MTAIPYVVGQWVRGEKFYGRAEQIAEILDGPRNWLWLLGTRRIGKTSLLKQVEYLTASDPERGYFPIFWDLQGAEDPDELHADFGDALLDAEERLEQIGVALAEIEDDDLFVSLGRLRRQLRSRNLRLLLLCDEVEELIRLNQKEPALLRKLRREMQSREGIRSVLASTIRLWALAEQKGDTSPFLHGFTPPLYIQTLSDDEARSLIRQSNLPRASRSNFDDETVETIRARCDNHPYLIQLVCKRYSELKDLEEALEQVATDRMVSYFFSVDFEMLSETERNVVRIIAEQSAAASDSIQESLSITAGSLRDSLNRLEQLGFIRRNEERRFILVNYFFRRWVKDLASMEQSSTDSSPAPGISTEETTLGHDVGLGVINGRYQLLQQVGAGATGIVYKAYDKLLQVKIAIKVLRSEFTGNEAVLERFRKEIVLSRDIGHPNVLRMYHLGEFGGKKYLTMQWVDGQTLASLIAAEAPLSEAKCAAIGAKLAAALQAAHAHKVLHRDIKPQNVLLDGDGEPHVTDFGVARVLGEPGITRTGIFLGTPNYASPEQANLSPLDGRSDLYALGVVLFEMATGKRPFEAATTEEILEMHKTAPAPDPRGLEPSISPEFSKLILRCLEKDRATRYPDVGALRSALEGLGRTPHL
jgi:tRNA A-37 threonylcarbamoyl transferase component Bud32